MPDPQPCECEAAPVAVADIPNLPYVRLTQRDKPPRNRRRVLWVLALVLVGHALVVWLAWSTPRQRPGPRHAVAVTLIEPESAQPLPPPLVMPPPLPGQPAPAVPPRHLHYVPPAPGAISATLQGVPGPTLQLYGPKGQVRLPSKASQQSVPAPAFSAPALQGSQILTIRNPVKYKPTRFAKDFAPTNQSVGTKLIDKAIEKTTIQKTIKLPLGVKVHCAINPLLMLAGGLLGCGGMPPPPPPKNDNDIRLSMPPAETLTGKKIPLPSSAASMVPPTSGNP